jgi:UDP-sugar transporter A1/2/3
VSTWISVAGIPAALYAIQNFAALLAYQNLDALTFNVLNQTKTLSAALCCYLVMGRTQSRQQIVALFLLLLSALIMERIITLDWILVLNDAKKPVEFSLEARHVTHGVAPVLFASFLSGLAGAMSQKNLQNKGRNPFLFSMELCAASSLILALSLVVSPDGDMIREQGFFGSDWNVQVFIPILTNAVGGILVGLVTKYAGSVRKGFALIFGILLSGLLQSESVSNEQIIGGILAAVSLWMHATNPSLPKAKPIISSVANGNGRPKQD